MAKVDRFIGGRLLLATSFGLAVALLLAGAGPVLAQSGAAGASAEADTAPTFSRDVAPILQRSCQQCHQPTGIAPMSLLTYREARPWARSIRDRVERRLMPPWHLDTTVGIQDYKNDISLTQEEIDTVVRWVDGARRRATRPICPPRWSSPAPTPGRWRLCSAGRPTSSCARRPTTWSPTGRTSGGTPRDRVRGLRRAPLHPRGRVQAVVPAGHQGHSPRARHPAEHGGGRGRRPAADASGRHGNRQAVRPAARGRGQAAAAGTRARSTSASTTSRSARR